MTMDRIGSGFTPGQIQDTGDARRGETPSPARTGDLSTRTSTTSSIAPRRNVSAAALQQIGQHINEAKALLDAGGAAMLREGAQDGFKSLPSQYRGLGRQTARLVGVM